MPRIELRTDLDRPVLDAILELIDASTKIEGHRPVGEHKYSHLVVGAANWAGVLAYEGQQLIGYAHTRWNAPGAVPRMAVEVVVHPDWYGSDVARLLVLQARSMLARAGGGVMFLWVHHVDDPETTLARRLGFAVQRQLAFMRRDLVTPPDEPSWPEGVEVRAYRPDVDDAEFLRVNNIAFRDHPENGGWDWADFLERRALNWFEADGLLMAWRRAPTGAAQRLLGFHWTKWHGHGSDEVPAHDPVGEVYVLGVDPEAQGSGLGRALLAAGLRHLHARGCREAVLYVDCASTSAVRLYKSEGFALAYQEVCYADEVSPVVEHRSDLLRPAF
ncbi:MAG: mycothiol synthase [Euzebyaceae bacterium]|nr:mycothiol synthase [Euzebyaceae bacterium]